MSPSGWHEEGLRRDAGHDEMQVGIWRYLRNLGYDVWLEHPFSLNGRAICFADILVKLPPCDGKEDHFKILEVKPKIYSVGATLRQCGAMEIAIEDWKRKTTGWGGCTFDVHPAVKVDDPKLELLHEAHGALTIWEESPCSRLLIGDAAIDAIPRTLVGIHREISHVEFLLTKEPSNAILADRILKLKAKIHGLIYGEGESPIETELVAE
jgi:hypothetical protein